MSDTDREPSSTADIVVTLVHGTWAPGAPWTQPGSPFCEQLQDELKDRGATSVTFSRFDWSGGNTHHARRLASIDLRKHLLNLLGIRPGARHYIVAHSHGGNVALRAVRQSMPISRNICGIVAIATPFLTFQRESFRLALLRPALQAAVNAVKDVVVLVLESLPVLALYSVTQLFLLVPLIAAFFLAWVVSKKFMPHVVHWLTYTSTGSAVATGYQVFAILTGIGLAILVLSWGWDEATEKNTEKLQRESRRVLLRYSYFQPEADLAYTPVLALSSFLDEAYGALAGSWWMHRATGWGVRSGIAAALFISLIVTAGVEYELARLMFATMTRLGWATLLKTASPIVLGASMMLSLWLASALVGLFLAISGRSSLGLGLADPDDNLVCAVRALRNLPLPIHATKKRYGTWQLLRHAKGALFHSRIYFHPPAITDIAAWISAPPRTSTLELPSTAIEPKLAPIADSAVRTVS